MTERKLGFLTERPRENGDFDELFGVADVHFEVMDDGHLWIGLDQPDKGRGCVHVNIFAKKGKLIIIAEDES